MGDFVLGIDWAIHKNLRITDIHEKVRYRVCDYMLEYFRQNELFKVLKFHENEATEKMWTTVVNHFLENDCSIMVTDEKTKEIRAVALVKWITPEWRSWTALRLIVPCPRMVDLFDLMLRNYDEYEATYPGEEEGHSLHLFFYRVDDDLLEDKCFMELFFNAICEVARHMKMSRVTYMALSNRDHEIISEYDFTETVSIMYSMFVLRTRQRPFDRLRDINEMRATLFVRHVEPLTPFQDFVVRHEHLSTKEAPKKRAGDKRPSRASKLQAQPQQQPDDD